MILYNDKRFITNSLYPNSDWIGDADYVVDDTSDLANKIINNYPYFDFVLDDEGNLMDVIATEPSASAIELLITNKKAELSKACQNSIYAGIDYNGFHYSLTDQDQTNIIVWSNVAEKGATVPYHADGEHCRAYTPEEFLGLTASATGHIAHHTTYCNLLMRWIETLTSANEINAVVYGETQLTGIYLEEYNANMALINS